MNDNEQSPRQMLERHWLASGYSEFDGQHYSYHPFSRDPAMRPANESDVQQLEARCGLTLPKDFRDYLVGYVATGEGVVDDELVTWWSIEHILSLADAGLTFADAPADSSPDTYLVFADYIQSCWLWAINCGYGQSRGEVVSDSPVQTRYSSFAEFVQAYVEDPAKLLGRV